MKCTKLQKSTSAVRSFWVTCPLLGMQLLHESRDADNYTIQNSQLYHHTGKTYIDKKGILNGLSYHGVL